MNSWSKIKRLSTYKRAVRKQRAEILKRVLEVSKTLERKTQIKDSQEILESAECNNDVNNSTISSTTDGPDNNNTIDTQSNDYHHYEESDDELWQDQTEFEKNSKFRSHLRTWAIKYQITHVALKSLCKIINTDISNILPEDPRTLLKTPKEVITKKLANGGEYWHHGFTKCLRAAFQNITEPQTISVNINMDGLPLFNSSRVEFWPILFNITEMPGLPAMVIGIYSVIGKCNDLQSFLLPFVQEKEMKEAMSNGLIINSHKIIVNLRCIICDSPARAYVKGVANFNAHLGCQKCDTVGDYSYVSNTNIFPRTECAKRTDDKFRKKMYVNSH